MPGPDIGMTGHGQPSRGAGRLSRRAFAAIDLGTNNCRLLVAEAQGRSLRVVDGYSEIVRLGEGLAHTGRLSEAAMARTLRALKACARKLANRPGARLRCIATQACRTAENGADFLARVAEETGLSFVVISPQEEARLAMVGCAALIDPSARAALVVDIGGGSTELTWVDAADAARAPVHAPILAWTSLPIGVVTLAERVGARIHAPDGYLEVVEEIRASLGAFRGADRWRPTFEAGGAHLVGASGTITSLAGVHLDLPRYQRAMVDGLWMSVEESRAAAARVRALDADARARHPCIGPQRADLVGPGAAILEAVMLEWPTRRIRVADRGLREGVLLTLVEDARRESRGGAG